VHRQWRVRNPPIGLPSSSLKLLIASSFRHARFAPSCKSRAEATIVQGPPRGAIGLMQIMPSTWAELSARYGLGSDPFDLRANILAGAAYLKEMHDRFGPEGYLAAYHAGPLRYEQHLAAGRALSTATLAYVAAVSSLLAPEHDERSALRIRPSVPWRRAPLFIERGEVAFPDSGAARDVQRTLQLSARSTVGSSTLAPLPTDLFVRPSNEGQSR
jgi:hypothetical protein